MQSLFKKEILIVDDEPSMVEIIRENLKEGGDYKIFVAYDAMQAIQLARRIIPDLILLDINMPAGGGENVYHRLKQMIPTKNIPIIIITGEDPDRITKLSVEKGIAKENIFLKPVEFDSLLKKIAAIFSE